MPKRLDRKIERIGCEEFRREALNMLAQKPEISGVELWRALKKRFDQEVVIGGFYVRMGELEAAGNVTRRVADAPTPEQRALRSEKQVTYFAITDQGRETVAAPSRLTL
ncbi:MAG: hypothetical protein SFW62_03850 [Alphaproteobacteria bacterium]|nr:hypothetical protein [Alphaproteobacteria bacterium]